MQNCHWNPQILGYFLFSGSGRSRRSPASSNHAGWYDVVVVVAVRKDMVQFGQEIRTLHPDFRPASFESTPAQ